MKQRVLVASPVRQKASILQEFLESLAGLDTTGLELDFAFIDDNDGQDGKALLAGFARGRPNVRIFPGEAGEAYHRDETTHFWRESLVWKIAGYKNGLIHLAVAGGYDFLFLVDSDLYLHPKTLTHLVSLGKDLVAAVYWTRWTPDMDLLPQVWVGDQYRLYQAARGETLAEEEVAGRTGAFLQKLSRPGTYRVGGLGGCTLISGKALATGVSFSEIYNLGFAGEDRHFCVRAAALGLELWADTHYSPFHIYRESDLPGLQSLKQEYCVAGTAAGREERITGQEAGPGKVTGGEKGSRLTLAMLVRNEAGRYLPAVLRQAARYIDQAVILDDASTDATVATCQNLLRDIPLTLVSNQEPGFHNEIALRKQLWELAVATGPNWIIILDADEIFEARAPEVLRELARDPGVCCYYFRLYDMWDENYYREDPWWCAHQSHRPFMVRCVPGFPYVWKETPLHCGRFPVNLGALPGQAGELRVKHLGWMRPADRLAKYRRYQRLDPAARYGVREQYQSILDPRPNLVPWIEDSSGARLPKLILGPGTR